MKNIHDYLKGDQYSPPFSNCMFAGGRLGTEPEERISRPEHTMG